MKVLPPEHEQAGRPYPTAGQEICTVAWGHTADDWARAVVVDVTKDGDPIVFCFGHPIVLKDPFEWRWPTAEDKEKP